MQASMFRPLKKALLEQKLYNFAPMSYNFSKSCTALEKAVQQWNEVVQLFFHRSILCRPRND